MAAHGSDARPPSNASSAQSRAPCAAKRRSSFVAGRLVAPLAGRQFLARLLEQVVEARALVALARQGVVEFARGAVCAPPHFAERIRPIGLANLGLTRVEID